VEILKLKSAVTQMESSVQGLRSRFELAEERISGLEDRSLRIIQFEEQKEDRNMNRA